jgi:hypothetical protein
MIGWLKCLFGFHDWPPYWQDNVGNRWVKWCRRCDKPRRKPL